MEMGDGGTDKSLEAAELSIADRAGLTVDVELFFETREACRGVI
jgi:hypothetical protein